MSNFLLAAQYTNYFSEAGPRRTILIIGVCLACASILGYLVTYFVKRDFLKKFLIGDLACFIAYSIAVAIYFIVADFKEGETYTQKYQLWLTIGIIVVAIALVVTAILLDRRPKNTAKEKSNSLSVAYAAVCIALAFGLSYVRMYKAPYGGSITLASTIPLAIYSYIFGWKKGLVCGLIYGFLQSVQDPWIVHPIQYLLDYPIAFGVIGLMGGMFNKAFTLKNEYASNTVKLTLGIVCGFVLRYIAHALSGAIFFGEYMPDTFSNVWIYTFTYNALYIFPDMAIAVIAGALLMASKAFRYQMNSTKGKLIAQSKVRVAVSETNAEISSDNVDESVSETK